MGLDATVDTGVLESTGVGATLSLRIVLVRVEVPTTTAQNQWLLGTAHDQTSPPVAAGAVFGIGGGWPLCGRGAGAAGCQTPDGHGLPSVLGCRALSPAGPQILEGAAPTEPAGLGQLLRYPMGSRRSGLLRRLAHIALGLLAHGPVVPPGLPPVNIRFVIVCTPGESGGWRPFSGPTCRPRPCRSNRGA